MMHYLSTPSRAPCRHVRGWQLLMVLVVPCAARLGGRFASARGTFRAGEGRAGLVALDTCPPLSDEEKADFDRFLETFEQNIGKAAKKPGSTKFLNSVLLKRDLAPPGLWLKFGVDMSCDIGACDKFGPLAEKAKTLSGTQVFGFDSFKGLPETWRSGYSEGTFNRHGNIPKPPAGVQWVVGWYDKTLPSFLANHTGDVGYLLVDSDICSSALYVLNTVYPRLADHALIYFDEIMNFNSYESGELLAFFRFLRQHRLKYDVVMAASDFQRQPQAE